MQLHRHRRAQGRRARDARSARPRDLDDLPEPARGAEPHPQGRPPDRGRAAPARPGRLRRQRPRRPSPSWSRCASRGPQERYHAYPFELSGGMCQRVVIALALACRPQLLIADEPTTGLDVTTQKTVMDLIVELTRERGMSTILITHDLGPGRRLLRPRGGDGEGQRGRDGRLGGDLQGAVARLYAQADARDAAAGRDAARPAARKARPSRAADRDRRPQARTALPAPAARQPRAAAGGRELVKEYPRKGVSGVARAGSSSRIRRRQGAGRAGARAGSHLPRRRRHQLHRRIAARASAWSASPAAASPPPRPW